MKRRVSNTIYYLPAVAFFLFYGMLALMTMSLSVISSAVVLVIALQGLAGSLLANNKWWGGLFGIFPAGIFILIGTQLGSSMHIAIGAVIFLFFLWAMLRVQKNSKEG